MAFISPRTSDVAGEKHSRFQNWFHRKAELKLKWITTNTKICTACSSWKSGTCAIELFTIFYFIFHLSTVSRGNVVTVNEKTLQLANEMFDDLKPHEKRIKISKVSFRLFPQAATSSRFRCRQWLLAVSSKHKSHDLISSLAQHFILFAFVPFAFSKMSSFCLSCWKQSWRKIEPRSALHVFHFLKASESPSCDFFRKSVDRDVLWPE